MKITATMPSVASYEIEYENEDELKEKICKEFEIERDLTNLIFQEDKVIVDYLWARQMIQFGRSHQKKLRTAKALVIGAGALGNEVAKNLAQLGFGEITLVDFDTVEFSNLNRTYFTKKDIGKGKAEALAENLRKSFPFAKVRAIQGKLEEIPVTELQADVILCCVDTAVTRLWLSEYSQKNRISVVDGGMKGLTGRVQIILPGGPCFGCTIPIERYGEAVGFSDPCDGVVDAKIPSFSTVSALIGSIQANEAMKIILDMKPLKGVLVVDLANNVFQIMELKKKKNCFICGKIE
jgi:molybdopterin/thiamine biosynthesis adenylyltransferase